jgi:hypothetical protein
MRDLQKDAEQNLVYNRILTHNDFISVFNSFRFELSYELLLRLTCNGMFNLKELAL